MIQVELGLDNEYQEKMVTSIIDHLESYLDVEGVVVSSVPVLLNEDFSLYVLFSTTLTNSGESYWQDVLNSRDPSLRVMAKAVMETKKFDERYVIVDEV